MDANFTKDKKGTINLLIHGMLGGRHVFFDCCQRLTNISGKFLDVGVLTYRRELDGTISSQVTPDAGYSKEREFIDQLRMAYKKQDFGKLEQPQFIPSPEFMQRTSLIPQKPLKIKLDFLARQGFQLMLRFEGSFVNPSTNLLVDEIANIVMNYLPREWNINLVGHSRGGLASLGCALKIPKSINKVITINSPYSTNFIAYLVGENKIAKKWIKSEGQGTADLSGKTPFLKNLREAWNHWGYQQIDLTAIGLGHGAIGDGIVDTNAQLGNLRDGESEYKYMKRVFIDVQFPSLVHSEWAKEDRIIEVLFKTMMQDKDLPRISEERPLVPFHQLFDKIAREKQDFRHDLVQKILRYPGPKAPTIEHSR